MAETWSLKLSLIHQIEHILGEWVLVDALARGNFVCQTFYLGYRVVTTHIDNLRVLGARGNTFVVNCFGFWTRFR